LFDRLHQKRNVLFAENRFISTNIQISACGVKNRLTSKTICNIIGLGENLWNGSNERNPRL
jgi:hypothetical protein